MKELYTCGKRKHRMPHNLEDQGKCGASCILNDGKIQALPAKIAEQC